MADLLALGIEQEGAHGWRAHVGPGRGPGCGWSKCGYTCRGEEEGVRSGEGREQGGWEQRGKGTGWVGRGEEKLLSHIPEPPETSQVFTLDRCAPDVP